MTPNPRIPASRKNPDGKFLAVFGLRGPSPGPGTVKKRFRTRNRSRERVGTFGADVANKLQRRGCGSPGGSSERMCHGLAFHGRAVHGRICSAICGSPSSWSTSWCCSGSPCPSPRFLPRGVETQTCDVLFLFQYAVPEVPTLSPGPLFHPEPFSDGPGARRGPPGAEDWQRPAVLSFPRRVHAWGHSAPDLWCAQIRSKSAPGPLPGSKLTLSSSCVQPW